MSSEKEDKKTNEKLLEEMKLMQSKMDALQEEVKKKMRTKTTIGMVKIFLFFLQ